jgi:hypothetical protein
MEFLTNTLYPIFKVIAFLIIWGAIFYYPAYIVYVLVLNILDDYFNEINWKKRIYRLHIIEHMFGKDEIIILIEERYHRKSCQLSDEEIEDLEYFLEQKYHYRNITYQETEFDERIKRTLKKPIYVSRMTFFAY